MKTLAVMNEKGGVGKTSLTAHAGWYLAERFRTLVIDLDQQANLTATLGAHLGPIDSVELFVRRGKRLLGLTEPGQELVSIVERILLDTQNIKKLAEQFSMKDRGQLTVATTHTQARYALPPVEESSVPI